MGKVQTIVIKDAFSWWLIDGYGRNKLPTNYSSYLRNARIDNKALTVRKWYKTLIENAEGTNVKWIIGNSIQNKLLCVNDSKLKEINLNNNTLTDLGNIGIDTKVNMFNHGKFVIILTWTNKFYVYDGNTFIEGSVYTPAKLVSSWIIITSTDLNLWKGITNWEFSVNIDGTQRNITWLNFSGASSFTQIADIIQTAIRAVTWGTETFIMNAIDSTYWTFTLSSSNTTSSSSVSFLTPVTGWTWTDMSWVWANPYSLRMNEGRWIQQLASMTFMPQCEAIIGVPFSWFTVIAGNTPDTFNNIYFSRPVTPTNPERAYDWTWTGSEKRNMQSKVLGMVSSLNNLFIFTSDTIEYTNKDSLSTLWGTFSFYSSPIGEGDQLLNYRCTTTANDRAFYITKDMTWKTLNYIPWTIDPAIGSLSDRPLVSIKNLLQNKLSEDQEDSFMVRKDDLIFWYGKSLGSTIIDIAVIYDITNDVFLVDDNIYYSCMTKFNWLYYGWSYLNWNIIQDNVNYDDDNLLTPFRYKTVVINFWNPVKRKLLKWRELAGELNRETKLQINTSIDNNSVSSSTINGEYYLKDISGLGIGWVPIGGSPIGWDIIITDILSPFEKVSDDGNINLKGKSVLLEIINTGIGWRFYLDFLAFILTPIWNYTLSDK